MPTQAEIDAAKLRLLKGIRRTEYESPAGRRVGEYQDADKQLAVINQLEAEQSTAPSVILMAHTGRDFRNE